MSLCLCQVQLNVFYCLLLYLVFILIWGWLIGFYQCDQNVLFAWIIMQLFSLQDISIQLIFIQLSASTPQYLLRTCHKKINFHQVPNQVNPLNLKNPKPQLIPYISHKSQKLKHKLTTLSPIKPPVPHRHKLSTSCWDAGWEETDATTKIHLF